MNKAIFISIFFLFHSVAYADYCDKAIPGLKKLLISNPVNDANQSVLSGDNRFLASYSYTFQILGVSLEESEIILQLKNYKVIEGSGDNFCNWPSSPVTLYEDIDNYIKIYNHTISNQK